MDMSEHREVYNVAKGGEAGEAEDGESRLSAVWPVAHSTTGALQRRVRTRPEATLVMHVQSGGAAWRPHKRTCRQPREEALGVYHTEREQ